MSTSNPVNTAIKLIEDKLNVQIGNDFTLNPEGNCAVMFLNIDGEVAEKLAKATSEGNEWYYPLQRSRRDVVSRARYAPDMETGRFRDNAHEMHFVTPKNAKSLQLIDGYQRIQALRHLDFKLDKPIQLTVKIHIVKDDAESRQLYLGFNQGTPMMPSDFTNANVEVKSLFGERWTPSAVKWVTSIMKSYFTGGKENGADSRLALQEAASLQGANLLKLWDVAQNVELQHGRATNLSLALADKGYRNATPRIHGALLAILSHATDQTKATAFVEDFLTIQPKFMEGMLKNASNYFGSARKTFTSVMCAYAAYCNLKQLLSDDEQKNAWAFGAVIEDPVNWFPVGIRTREGAKTGDKVVVRKLDNKQIKNYNKDYGIAPDAKISKKQEKKAIAGQIKEESPAESLVAA